MDALHAGTVAAFLLSSLHLSNVKRSFRWKVIVPEEPLALKPNQKLRIQIEPIEPAPKRTNFSEWIGLAGSPTGKPYDPAEEDALWEKKVRFLIRVRDDYHARDCSRYIRANRAVSWRIDRRMASIPGR